MKERENGKLFGYVRCDIEVLEKIKAIFAKNPPFFKNTLASKNDFVDLMKNCAEEKTMVCEPRKVVN